MLDLLKPGVRTFTVASCLTFVVALLHTLALAGESPDPGWAAALDAMRNATVEAGVFRFSLYGVFESVWIEMGALLAMMAGKDLLLVVLTAPETRVQVARALSLFNVACYAILTALFAYYLIPPPLISFAVLTLAFSLAAALAHRVAGVGS